LAPTVLEAGRVVVPEVMTAKTLWPVLHSQEQGWVDPARGRVFMGRERHVARARAGNLPYPQRAIRTKDYLLVINFRPDRYPLGDHYRLEQKVPIARSALTGNTFVTIPDEDAGPTKAWLVEHRSDPAWKSYFQQAYGRRPRLELYEASTDPDQMNNLAANPQFSHLLTTLEQQLLAEMKATGDPRLIDDGRFYEEVEKFDARSN